MRATIRCALGFANLGERFSEFIRAHELIGGLQRLADFRAHGFLREHRGAGRHEPCCAGHDGNESDDGIKGH